VEDRSSWLPPGLEGPSEPDDRASHRGGPKSGKRPDGGPAAAGQQGPYDHEDPPESDRSQSDSTEADKPSGREQPAEAEKPSAEKPSDRPAEPEKPSDWSQPDSGEPDERDDSKTDDAEERRPEPVAAKDEGPKTEDSKRPDQNGSGGPHEDQPRRKAERKKNGDERRRDEHVHMPSDVDARGEDKYRKVIGQHNPNRGRQLLYYGIFIAFIVVAYVGLSAAVDQLDKAPAHDPAKAPWAQPGAPQGPLGGFAPRKQGQKGPTHFQ
jgi:hypothetical protein